VCDPVSIAMFTFSTIGTLMERQAAQREAAQVAEHNRQAHQLTIDQSNAALKSEQEALAAREAQTQQAAANEATEIAIQSAKVKASVRVAQGESGLTGSTLALLQDVAAQTGVQFTRLNESLSNELAQVDLERDVAVQNRNNAISSSALGGNQRSEIARGRVPGLGATFLNIGSSAVDIFGSDFSDNISSPRTSRTPAPVEDRSRPASSNLRFSCGLCGYSRRCLPLS